MRTHSRVINIKYIKMCWLVFGGGGRFSIWSSPQIVQIIHAGLQIVAVTSAFGKFLCFYVQRTRQDLPSTSNPPLRRNAFKIMMSAQAEKVSVVLPNKVQVRNKKDELFNDILQLIEKEGIVWKASEVDNGTAANAICTLRDALWYIDGHHQTLADRSCHVPHVFTGFVEYNNPEKSKHRKRSSSTLCRYLEISFPEALWQSAASLLVEVRMECA